MAKVFVLGSNSFAGTSFIDYCLHQECEVVGVSRSPEAPTVLNAYRKNHHLGRLQFFQKNINTDFNEVVSLIREFEPDYIVDFAGQSMSTQSWEHPVHWYQTNVLTKVKLLEEIRKLKSLKRYLRISTPEVYGEASGSLKEDQSLRPETPYSVSHATQDMTMHAYFKQHGFPVVTIRSSYFYGQHQQFYRLIPRIIIHGRLNKKLILNADANSRRSFIHIWDFCEAAWKILTQSPIGETYHVGSTETVTLDELTKKIAQKMHVANFVDFKAAEAKTSRSYVLNDEKIRAQLQWQPQVDLDQGLEQVISWVDQNIKMIQTMPLDYIHKE